MMEKTQTMSMENAWGVDKTISRNIQAVRRAHLLFEGFLAVEILVVAEHV